MTLKAIRCRARLGETPLQERSRKLLRSSRILVLIALSIWAVSAVPFASGAPAPQKEYVFVPNTDRWVGILYQRDQLLLGKLDAAGNFLQHRQVSMGGPRSGLPPHVLLNFPGPEKPKRVYEFRSGRLVPGELDETGNFVPAVGSAVIKFEDYTYSPTAIPIWNLPGYFQKKEAHGSGKDEKK